MGAIRIIDAEGSRLERWDEDIARSVNGTLFHLRRFLAYHGTRFSGSERFLLVLDGDSVLAQIPVAVSGDPGSGRHLRSPYGASYGGFAFQRYPSFRQAQAIVEAFQEWCRREGITQATITPPIAACAELPLDVFSFALLHAGFRSVSRDVSSLLALDPRRPAADAVSARARNTGRKAERAEVTVQTRASIEDFWSVMDATFERHGTQPTHTLDEIDRLARSLPDRVYVDVAYHASRPVAGVAYFVINQRVNSSFYLCQRPEQRELNALTLCVIEGLERARAEGYRFFDFGTSTVAMQPRPNVFRFKESFTSAGQFRETFEWTAAATGA